MTQLRFTILYLAWAAILLFCHVVNYHELISDADALLNAVHAIKDVWEYAMLFTFPLSLTEGLELLLWYASVNEQTVSFFEFAVMFLLIIPTARYVYKRAQIYGWLKTAIVFVLVSIAVGFADITIVFAILS